ncbi:MAG: hypothetical protein M1820_008115 [Bogoriella megaspora]|nr:MAG: hypothetical protein M1820_008115 [Bogoriella megaspora]
MVKISTVRKSILRFAKESEHDEGLVCVFAGATSGIGASTLETLARILSNPTFYVLGRSEEQFASQRARLASLNPGCKIVFLEAQFSLLSDVDAICKRITLAETKVDYLCMSPGVIPINGPEYTGEGLELYFAISYYSRMRLLANILPLLRQSAHPRVLSVLSAGREASIHLHDLELQQNWSFYEVLVQASTMTTLTFEYLAQQETHMTLIHARPGAVLTENFARLTAPAESSLAWKALLCTFKFVFTNIARWFGTSLEESGERQAFHLTSPRFGPGVWRLGSSSNPVPSNRILAEYIENGWPEKVWDHTMRVFDRVTTADI